MKEAKAMRVVEMDADGFVVGMIVCGLYLGSLILVLSHCTARL